jgi:tRNA A-37 threonylcarbamoyl transferase component Bud32
MGIMPDPRESAQGIGYPERVGRYELLLPIASGGMATVYLARTQGIAGFERQVALKLVHPHLQAEAEFSRGLIEEAKLSARIRHPNVVSVLDVGRDPAGVYMVMDYVEGSSLSGLLRAGRAANDPVPMGVALKIVTDALAGLHAAHELTDARGQPVGLVHRDFSPQNVLVGVDGVGWLTDFGVAKAATRLSRTATGTVKGKLAYMAPEQGRAERVDRRSDIWSVGVVLWELLSRRRLFSGNEAQMILGIVSGDVPPLSSLVPDVPPALEAVIASALSIDPRRRPATARDLRAALISGATGAYALADVGEVAAYVERLIAPTLARRRQRIDEVLRLRSELTRVVSAEELAGPQTPPRSVPEPARADDSAGAALETQPVKSPRWHPIVIAAAGIGIGVLASLLVARGAGSRTDALASSAASLPVAPTAVLEPLASAAPDPEREPPRERELLIEASLPIARLVVDGREQPIDPPARQVRVSIPERARTLVAVSSDGKRAALKVSSDRRTATARFPQVGRTRGAKAADPLSGYNPYAEGER